MDLVITNKINIFNRTKYTSALIISVLGTEIMKLSASVYAFKLTESFWFVTLFYLAMQIPSIFVFFFGSKIVNRFKDKQMIFFADFSSFIVVTSVLITFLSTDLNHNGHSFSILLLVANAFYSFFNSIRFLAVRNIIFHLSNNNNDMKLYNILNSFGLIFASFLAPILGIFLFKFLPLWVTLSLNMLTYIVSTSLYMSLKVKKNHLEFSKEKDVEINHTNASRITKWIFATSFGILTATLLFPKQSGVNNFFNYIHYDYKDWTFIFSICIFGFALLASLFSFLINKFSSSFKSKGFYLGIILIAGLNLIWLPINLSNNSKLILITYLILNSLIQFIFSIITNIGNSYIFMIFDKKEFTKQNSLILLFRILYYSGLILILTALYIYVGFVFMFIVYSIIILLLCVAIVVSKYKIASDKK
ncbi:membrane protein [Mycoplasmopsis canis]|uniref:MFS transporter n=1 Tax=Mycoplasmopsis canis TaxID=29555 RepID=UPI000624DBE9|nr:MFS transporter [Mycoplasmopsis canis]AKF41294.1 membrane protein [Mycoplasmopsis canis]